MTVAIQGEIASFHHSAALRWYGQAVDFIYCDSFPAVFEALKSGSADEAVVAIENSLVGSIYEVYDLLVQSGYPIIGEIVEHIAHNLIGLPGASIADIEEVYSHPVALAQCSNFLSGLMHAESIEYNDTAGAVMFVRQHNNRKLAAVASEAAAKLHDMEVLKPHIENDRNNFTRFLIIKPGAERPHGANKASLVLHTSHEPGALYAALGAFANRTVNMSKLVSQPIVGEAWSYQFLVDVDAAGAMLAKALKDLEYQGCHVVNLGEYVANLTPHRD